MGIFKRMADILRANINDLLSRAEDPEKMLNQMLIEMREQLADAKRQVAVAIADERKLRRQLDMQNEESAKWEQRAMAALQAGKEDLAKQALGQRNTAQELAKQYQEQWEKQAEAVEALKNALKALNLKIEDAKRRKDLLIARQKRAQAQKQIQETLQGIGDHSAFETFERMEQRVMQQEAEAEAAVDINKELAGTNLEEQFAQLDTTDLDGDLAELRSRMGMGDSQVRSVEVDLSAGDAK
ncbi:MAG: PspA/IM30 family protein [Armatimonadetes bacterium]|nr:PspA/IM30 family protein [Armatimonadota bacterium]